MPKGMGLVIVALLLTEWIGMSKIARAETIGKQIMESVLLHKKVDKPPLFQVSETHYAATWLLHPLAPKVEMPPELKQRIEQSLREAEAHQ